MGSAVPARAGSEPVKSVKSVQRTPAGASVGPQVPADAERAIVRNQ
jgi:hypothetical protein